MQDRRRGSCRWTRAGFNPTGSDDSLLCELRCESPLTPVARDLTVPANKGRSVWVCSGGVSLHLQKGVTVITPPSEARPPLHSDRVPRFCLQSWIVSHTLKCLHDDRNRSHCLEEQVGENYPCWNIFIILLKCPKQTDAPYVIFSGAQAGTLLLAHDEAFPIPAHRLFL